MTTGIIVVLETARSTSDDARSLVATGQQLAGMLDSPLTVVMIGDGETRAADAVTWDVAELILVDGDAVPVDGLAAQRLVGELVAEREPSVVLLPHTGLAAELAPALAAAGGYGFGGALSSLKFDGQLTGSRPRYGGKVVEDLEFDRDRTTVVTVREGALAVSPPTSSEGPASVKRIAADNEVRVRRTGLVSDDGGDIDITKADFLLAIGRGVGSSDNVDRFAALADRLGATLAASRPLVDLGWVESARQVGQSGKTVKPKVYLALGISGSIQHLTGVRSADTVIAVNSDPSAPIFEVADYGAVTDIFDLADALEAELGSS